MTARRGRAGKPPDSLPPPNVTVARAEAESQITSRIEKGKQILDLPIHSDQDLDKARDQYRKWNDFNKELLRRIFDSPEVSDEYSHWVGIAVLCETFLEKVEEHLNDTEEKIRRLESIRERLSLYKEPSAMMKPIMKDLPTPTTRTVFVVHGRDEAFKEAVARFLNRLELNSIILHEQPNQGRTILEKLEYYSSVAFAVVLLTPDDIGGPSSDSDKLLPRARQNVVFELGYFIGKLGRERVCALHSEGVELPSDFAGVAYVPLDRGGAWKVMLAREIKAAGLDVDLNKLA